jgi:hypothetical protein
MESEPVIKERRLIIKVGVVVERRKGVTRWAEHVWRPVAVFTGGASQEGWHEMRSGEDWTQFYAGTQEIELHRSDAEDYARSLTSPRPAIYVVLAPARGEIPWRVQLVTASPGEAEAYTVGGDHIVEGVPIPDDIRPVLEAFVDSHYRPQKFKKRQRDRPPALEEQKFGKEPIFARRPGQRPGGSSNG